MLSKIFATTRHSEATELRTRVSLEREGNEHIQRISKVVNQVRWGRSILGIMWTAGPVTLLGLFGGFFLAYGKPPPTQTLIYFFGFTVCSGFIAFFAKLIYNMMHGPQVEQAQQDVTESIDKLADLILAVRDLIIASHEEETRPREAALHLLRRIELTPDGVAFAAEELTNDTSLAKILGRIETYRRAGLYSRVKDLNQQHQEHIEATLSQLQEASPEAASLLRERFNGVAIQLEKGIPREEYFIERILAAIEEDDPQLMTLQDIEEMLILAFELISGRKIPMLIFSYSGKWKLARILDELEQKRSYYRTCQASGSNRIRALAGFLVEVNVATHEQLPYGVSAHELISTIELLMDQLALEVTQLISANTKQQDKNQGELRAKAEVLAKSLHLYKAARTSYAKLGRAHAALLEASAYWNQLTDLFGNSASQLKLGPGSKGIRINERQVALNDVQKVTFCQRLVTVIHNLGLEKRGHRFFTKTAGHYRPLTLDNARHLALEVTLASEPHLQLSNPGIQRGLNATNATYLGGLQPNMSAAEKAALGAAMAKDVKQDMSRAAEHLALALVKHYRVDLTETARDFLIDTYGARLATLEMLAKHEPSPSNGQVSFLSLRPPLVPAPKREWYKALIQARQELI